MINEIDIMKCSTHANISDEIPAWFASLVGDSALSVNTPHVNGVPCVYRDGIMRLNDKVSAPQAQTKESFGYKWSKKETFESHQMLFRMKQWLIERYGQVSTLLDGFSDVPVVLDAGCGAGMSGLELWGDHIDKLHYLGVDISSAVDVCRERMMQRGMVDAAYMQADIAKLPLPSASVDIVFSEGVMHHTDCTRTTFLSLAHLVKPAGYFMFYVYHQKGPIREFVDDYIRDKLQSMSPDEAWDAVRPLSQLGKVLGELNLTVRVPEPIDLLDIPAGEINLQRLFYWHIFKAYYDESLTLEEMNHINYDWYAPRNAHRHTVAEVQQWCEEASFSIVRQVVEPAGITIIAQRRVSP